MEQRELGDRQLDALLERLTRHEPAARAEPPLDGDNMAPLSTSDGRCVTHAALAYAALGQQGPRPAPPGVSSRGPILVAVAVVAGIGVAA
jgi:hypothetical protein